MQVAVTQQLFRDLQRLSSTLASKTHELMGEIRRIDPAELRQSALPGWRLHALRGANTVTLSVDMNFRIIARLDGPRITLLRVVRHDTSDRAEVNRNDLGESLADLSADEVKPGDIYELLRSFGVLEADAGPFRGCTTEDDLLTAASGVSAATADLALSIYETSGIVIPRARFRVLESDEDFAQALEGGVGDWEMYLHPSQAYLVELPTDFRAAVQGSAGTGKTVAAWHRTKLLMNSGAAVGFVCAHESILSVSKKRLLDMAGPANDRSYFFVPQQADELLQLAQAVDHIVIDEAQELPTSWLAKLAEKANAELGVTLFYDINQLGGNIPNKDRDRYLRRISDWKATLNGFARMQRFTLSINYRNAREIAEHYLAVLSSALPAKPSAGVPTFETGEVVQQQVKAKDLGDALGSLVHRLLRDLAPHEIGIVTLDQGPGLARQALAERNVSVTDDPTADAVVVASASTIRGHERPTIIVTTNDADALRRNFGVAIDAYIAMSRAVKRLIVLEVVP